MGMSVTTPYDKEYWHIGEYGKLPEIIDMHDRTDFSTKAFALTDLNGHFKHTNADGTECPCYGFLIQHPEMGRLLYITDTELVKWKFKNINHILISCNYQKKYVTGDDAKKSHVLRGHMELETVKEFVKANKSNALRNVILCHASKENLNCTEAKSEVEKVVNCPVYIATPGETYDLSLVPF